MRLKNNSVGTQTSNNRIREVVTGLLYESLRLVEYESLRLVESLYRQSSLTQSHETLHANPRSENCHFLASPELTAKRATRG